MPWLRQILEMRPFFLEYFRLKMMFARSIGRPMQLEKKRNAEGCLAGANEPARKSILCGSASRCSVGEINVVRANADVRGRRRFLARNAKLATPIVRLDWV